MSSDSGGLPPDSSNDNEDQQEQKAVTFSWGILMVRTKKLLNLLDSLAQYRIFSDLGWVFIAITIASGAFMIWLMVDETYLVLNSSLALRCLIGAAPTAQCHASGLSTGTQPALTSYLLLPGINPYIPVLYGLIGIIVAVVVHEGTHGVIARRLHVPVKSTGILFFLFVPIGAFVEPDEKHVQKMRARDSDRIMAGGPGSNIIVGAVALILLVLLLGGLVPRYSGVYVTAITSPSPANQLHSQGYLEADDSIMAVNGTAITSEQSLSNFMAGTKPNESLVITIEHQGHLQNYSIILGTNPNNQSIGFIGVSVLGGQDLYSIRNTYATAYIHDPLLYLLVPGIVSEANSVVPFSSTLSPLYTSPTFGDAWAPIALTLFWIFFVNINLAFFNAIPLYPLDGGQALFYWFSHFGKKWVEVRAKLLTTIFSALMLALLLIFIFLPRILAMIPY